MYRYNSTTSTLGSGGVDVRRETEAGTDYLVVPGVIAREGVLSYDHGDELLPSEELETLATTESAPIVLDHPITSNGQFVSVNSPAAVNREIVGEFRNPELIPDSQRANADQGDDPQKVRGEYWLRLDKRDVDPGYADALETLEAGGEWPTSPGYDPDIDHETGRYNGDEYDAIQRNPALDHVGLIVTSGATARATPEQGVAAGRANAAFTADQTHAMTPDPPTDDPDETIWSRLNAIGHALTGQSVTANADLETPADGGDPDADAEADAEADTESESETDADETPADTDPDASPETDPDSDTDDPMDDDPRIQTLVDAGLSEDALEDASDALLDDLAEMHDDADEPTETDTDADADGEAGDDAPESDTPDVPPEADSDDVEFLTRDEAESLITEAQEAPVHDELDQQITANADISESALDAMTLEDKRALADTLEAEDDQSFTPTPSTPTASDAHRANMAGVPGQVSRDDDGLDDNIPAAGYNRRSEGDE